MGGRFLLAGAVAAGVLFAGRPCPAAGGVGEIHHACAVHTGCFSGDAPGYPVTIDGTAGRSYRLTSDLVLPDENTDGILVTAPSVSIDLGGFSIVRAGCEHLTGASCRPASGSGSGIRVEPALLTGVSVEGGAVSGMGDAGVWLGRQSRVVGVRVRSNRTFGIRVAQESLVVDNTARDNLQGIFAMDGSVVAGNLAVGNLGDGIEVLGAGAVVQGNVASDNGSRGIEVGTGSTVVENVASRNGGAGIAAGQGCNLLGNTVMVNGGDGIEAGSGSSAQRNTIRRNTGWGIRFTDGPPARPAAYRENKIDLNAAGTVSGHGLDLGGNACDTTPSCP